MRTSARRLIVSKTPLYEGEFLRRSLLTGVGVEKVTVISDRNGGRSMVISKEECLPCCGSPFSEAC